MKTLTLAIAAFAVAGAFAEPKVYTLEESAAMKMRTFGGMVRKANSERGKILIVNAQKKANFGSTELLFKQFKSVIKLPIELKDGEISGGKPSKAAVKAAGADFVVWVVENADCENDVTVAPGSRWAVVNVAALDDDNPSAEVLSSRVSKMTMRAFALLCGCANSTRSGTVVGPIEGYGMLDGIKYAGFPIEAYQRLLTYLHGCKVDPYIETTYELACRQGWAPKPANPDQQRIWDKVHELPTKPITIQKQPQKK